MTQLADPLVGRAEELRALEAALDGRAGAVELVGEPGIGKTRLLAELERIADERGCLVLSGSASELERDLPFWVFVDALDEYVRGLPPRGARDDSAGARAGPAGPAARRAAPTSATAPTRRSASC